MTTYSCLFLICLLVHCCFGNTGHSSSSSAGEEGTHNFDVTGFDFLNTQTTKLCLLARLNVSLTFTYQVDSSHIVISIPSTASNSRSYCDFNFISQLQLDFDGISFGLVFRRDSIKSENTPQAYCDKCDGGHWRLHLINVSVADISHNMHNVPPSKIMAEAAGTELSHEAGSLITHISLRRGYRCSEEVLSTNLKITEAYNLKTNEHTMRNWTVKVHFFSINIQPFLVTNDIIKDPLLCKDVSVSIILIITMPIVYFMFFILCFRLRDEKILSNWRKKFKKGRSEKDVNGKKPLLKSSFIQESPSTTCTKITPVSVTCTTPDKTRVNLI